MENKDKLILALDTSDLKEIDSIINDVVPPLSFVKVGPVSFLPNSKELIDIISSKNLSVMFDFKFFDIPNTIENSLKFLFDINTKIFTMHCLAGPGLIKSVLKELNNLEQQLGKVRPDIFGVTILTSFDQKELNSIGFNGSIADNVLKLVETSVSAGIDGVVCSGEEIDLIKNNFGDSVKILVPGVRKELRDDDQKRIITPKQAIEKGADYLVLGRTLTDDPDKKKRINDILNSL